MLRCALDFCRDYLYGRGRSSQSLPEMLGSLILLLIGVAVQALIVMWLWNFVAPTFNLPQIDFWQALVLKLLTSFLFL